MNAECEAKGIKERVFHYSWSLLQGWRDTFTGMFPNETCTIPDPEAYRLARLARGSSVVSSGCIRAF
jgi:hypothetical protein